MHDKIASIITEIIIYVVRVCILSHLQLFVSPWTVPTRLLCPWSFPGKNTGMGCLFFLQGIFLTQRLNLNFLRLLHWQVKSLPPSHQASLYIFLNDYYLFIFWSQFTECRTSLTKDRTYAPFSGSTES